MFFLKTLIFLFLFISIGWSDQIKLLDQNNQAFQARIQLIKSAKKEILVEYFLTHQDPYSLLWFALYKEAALRNVKIKILIDDLHNELTQAQMAAILGVSKDSKALKNIEIKVFNPLKLSNPMYLTYRNHDKLLAVDAETDEARMVIGGRNPPDQYFGQSQNNDNFKDTDAFVIGKSAQAARAYFMVLWQKNPDVKPLNLGKYSFENFNKVCGVEDSMCEINKTDDLYAVAQAEKALANSLDTLMPLSFSENLAENLEEVGPIQFLSNNPALIMKDIPDYQKISAQIMSLIEKARQKVLIVTPYLYPTEEQLAVFKRLSERGVQITLVTNSLYSTNKTIVHAALSTITKRLADMGISLLYYKGLVGAEILHGKAVLIDDQVSFIGSFNFDRRSALLNREIGIVIQATESLTKLKFTQDYLNFINREIIDHCVIASEHGREYDLGEFESNVLQNKKSKLEQDKSGIILHYFPDHI